MERSAGITASAVLAFIGSAFTLLMGAFALVGALAMSRLPTTRPSPINVGAIVAVEALFFFGFGAWGVASGVGLLDLEQWARISVIVFAAILVFCFVPAALITAVILLPNTAAQDLSASFMTILRISMVTFHSALGLLGGFWLYFFNRKSVEEQFRAQRPMVAAAAQHLAAGAPTTVAEAPAAMPAGPVRRERPLSITVIAWFLLLSSAFAVISLPLSGQFFPGSELPMYFLGRFFVGRSAHAILIVWMAAQALAAVGLLKLKRAGLFATIALQCLAILNVTLLAALPGARAKFQNIMDTFMSSMNANMPQPLTFKFPGWASAVSALPVVLVILWFLTTRRHAFTSADNDPAVGRN